MPSLLDLTSQGDVGTIADESQLATVTLMGPQQLYELWERQNWQSHTIDLAQDVRDWAADGPRAAPPARRGTSRRSSSVRSASRPSSRAS